MPAPVPAHRSRCNPRPPAHRSPPQAAAAACGPLQRELSALALSGAELVPRLERLPRVDLVLLALYDPQLDDPQEQYG